MTLRTPSVRLYSVDLGAIHSAIVTSFQRMIECIFFFQAEDGIRDPLVTGVQTCALPILPVLGNALQDPVDLRAEAHVEHAVGLVEDEHAHGAEVDHPALDQVEQPPRRGDEDRSEERRVGKEWRCRGMPWREESATSV